MNAPAAAKRNADPRQLQRFHRIRRVKDLAAQRLIALGGISVIVAVVLILFYLAYVVFPLFLPADASLHDHGARKDWVGSTPVYISIEEQQRVGFRVDSAGVAEFFEVDSLASISRTELFESGSIVAAVEAAEGNGNFALATDQGQILLARFSYKTNFDNGVANRKIIPTLDFPFRSEPRPLGVEGDYGEIRSLAFSDDSSGMVVAAAFDQAVAVEWVSKQENFLTGETSLQSRTIERSLEYRVSNVAVSGNHRWLYISDEQGRVHRLGLPSLEEIEDVEVSDVPLTSMKMLLGGVSVLAGDANGRITQLFPVRDEDNNYELKVIRHFEGQTGPIVEILPEYRRKGFLALDAGGKLGIYHSTAGQMVFSLDLPTGAPVSSAVAPRANGLLLESAEGQVSLLEIDNEHPEVSIDSLWRKVWYENYPEPRFVWQSSAASNEFEPKFSLTPLAFGTLKAAIFAMLFALPFALMGAAYAAYFMAPQLREIVKPTIEIMAALPTVILGFLAGLWFAPFLEENLASLVSVTLLLPPGLILFGYWWSHYSGPGKSWVREGWEPALLLPVIVGLTALSMQAADPIQTVLFGGDMRNWLSQEMGISYDQRNALVVGFAMGFAVIPTVFSMAEDAIFGVPKSLSDGSLALGATPWQTLVRVILPTASPGIFSALMIGLGRAVGETMIVLMATGNTPVMDWSVFEGMRTLAANIAVEMPESEVDSSHYRILFLAALVLFMFTFVVNTGAEIIRQRLRERYSSL